MSEMWESGEDEIDESGRNPTQRRLDEEGPPSDPADVSWTEAPAATAGEDPADAGWGEDEEPEAVDEGSGGLREREDVEPEEAWGTEDSPHQGEEGQEPV